MKQGPEIRIGTVSTVDYRNGMVSVKYNDLSGSVTADMPMLSMNGEYSMPKIDDTVLVVYLSNGSSIGIVLGTFWNEANRPPLTGKDVFYKRLAEDAYIKYKNGELVVKAPTLKIITDNETKVI